MNNTIEGVFFSRVAGLQPATLLKMTPQRVPSNIFDYKRESYFVKHVSVGASMKRSVIKISLSLHAFLQKTKIFK